MSVAPVTHDAQPAALQRDAVALMRDGLRPLLRLPNGFRHRRRGGHPYRRCRQCSQRESHRGRSGFCPGPSLAPQRAVTRQVRLIPGPQLSGLLLKARSLGVVRRQPRLALGQGHRQTPAHVLADQAGKLTGQRHPQRLGTEHVLRFGVFQHTHRAEFGQLQGHARVHFDQNLLIERVAEQRVNLLCPQRALFRTGPLGGLGTQHRLGNQVAERPVHHAQATHGVPQGAAPAFRLAAEGVADHLRQCGSPQIDTDQIGAAQLVGTGQRGQQAEQVQRVSLAALHQPGSQRLEPQRRLGGKARRQHLLHAPERHGREGQHLYAWHAARENAGHGLPDRVLAAQQQQQPGVLTGHLADQVEQGRQVGGRGVNLVEQQQQWPRTLRERHGHLDHVFLGGSRLQQNLTQQLLLLRSPWPARSVRPQQGLCQRGQQQPAGTRGRQP